MLFNSFFYIFLFLPLSIAVYFFLAPRNKSLGNAWLVICSLAFYSWWNIVYLPLLLGSITVNYLVAQALIAPQWERSRRLILIFGVVFNLGLLGYFKYTDFFIGNVDALLKANIALTHIILPLGVSFFTFTQTAFLVDAYQGKVKENNFINYMLFSSFFPHLLAGPIVHHSEVMPQFKTTENRKIHWENMLAALMLFSFGLFKKSVIADSFAVAVNSGFSNLASLNLISAWKTSLAYTFQIYFDFSGYTDMAIASALFFNIKFPINFSSPYKSLSIQDFWRRWHITLSRFLRDYLYIPLGGNRVTTWRIYFNLLATFVLGGLWHGANWTFVFWGFLHGTALILHRIWQRFGVSLNRYLAWFITFNFINITWVFFRANTWGDAWVVLRAMFDFHGVMQPDLFSHIGILIYLLLALLVCLLTENTNQWIAVKAYEKKGAVPIVVFILLISILVISYRDSHEFIYFQF